MRGGSIPLEFRIDSLTIALADRITIQFGLQLLLRSKLTLRPPSECQREETDGVHPFDQAFDLFGV